MLEVSTLELSTLLLIRKRPKRASVARKQAVPQKSTLVSEARTLSGQPPTDHMVALEAKMKAAALVGLRKVDLGLVKVRLVECGATKRALPGALWPPTTREAPGNENR